MYISFCMSVLVFQENVESSFDVAVQRAGEGGVRYTGVKHSSSLQVTWQYSLSSWCLNIM